MIRKILLNYFYVEAKRVNKTAIKHKVFLYYNRILLYYILLSVYIVNA